MVSIAALVSCPSTVKMSSSKKDRKCFKNREVRSSFSGLPEDNMDVGHVGHVVGVDDKRINSNFIVCHLKRIRI